MTKGHVKLCGAGVWGRRCQSALRHGVAVAGSAALADAAQVGAQLIPVDVLRVVSGVGTDSGQPLCVNRRLHPAQRTSVQRVPL